jgi:hypothetical protein
VEILREELLSRVWTFFVTGSVENSPGPSKGPHEERALIILIRNCCTVLYFLLSLCLGEYISMCYGI